MTEPQVQTDQIIGLVSDIITPIFDIDRTMVMPFDLKRHENVGEHSLALSLLACAIAKKIDPTLDTGKIAQYAVVHDIAEIYAGDITVWESDQAKQQKIQNEEQAVERILGEFPQLPWIAKSYQEYEKRDTPEKRYIYALDKLYPHILILIADHHPVKPSWEAYKRTEEVAYSKISSFPALLPLFDDLCAMFRQKPHFFSTPIPSGEQS